MHEFEGFRTPRILKIFHVEANSDSWVDVGQLA